MLPLVELRRMLHRIPELAGNESETAKILIEELQATTPDELYTNVAGYGIIAVYKGQPEKPSVMFRADMDALPIEEDPGLDYCSERNGVAHVCGHDGHMSMLVGLARKIAKNRQQFGDVILLFQPAEETGQGAIQILKDDAFRNVNPQFVFGFHSIPGYQLNSIILKKGVFNSASVGITIRLLGKTSHASHPERGKSPALALAELIQYTSALPYTQSFKDVTLTTVIHALLGEIAFGTSPGKAEFRATLRAFVDTDLEKLKKLLEEKVEQLSQKYQLAHNISYNDYFPANKNDDEAVELVFKAAQTLQLSIIKPTTSFRWSDDFAYFSSEFQTAYFGFGAGLEQPELHASNFDFPDEILENGVKLLYQILKLASS
ncbi:MAG TPA: amidohydrolase [Salinivirgaceae bacterium]|nr:amidohydrolase [Salinivirgaceae bacterium]